MDIHWGKTAQMSGLRLPYFTTFFYDQSYENRYWEKNIQLQSV